MKNIYKIVIVISITFLFYSCKSVEPCPSNPAIGNTGAMFNTENDEYSPYSYNGYLYYTAKESEGDKIEKIYKSKIDYNIDDSKGVLTFGIPVQDSTLPLHNMQRGGLPRFYDDEFGNTKLLFAAYGNTNDNLSSDIYHSEMKNNQWFNTRSFSELNTEFYDSHPTISTKGDIIVFASDRTGSVGDIDLYFSKYYEDTGWMEPINLGQEINSYATEISPFLDRENNLYFASNKIEGAYGGYDIYKAEFNGTKWEAPRLLPFPINTEYNETGPYVNFNKIFVASDRRGGCGGKDLYNFELCGPVKLSVRISSENGNSPLEGTLYLLNNKKEKLKSVQIGSDGNASLDLTPMRSYYLQYFNSCIPNYVPEQEIYAPCSDTSSVKLVAEFVMPDGMKKIEFEEYNIPFFVSGYYMPNTRDNLQSLRLKFEYGLLGNGKETRYIEKPGNKYDAYSVKVEEALNNVSETVYSMIDNLEGDCYNSQSNNLKIKILGYADPRAISEVARYMDDNIDDADMGVSIEKGSQIDNSKLSLLRAYYTAKYLENYLKNFSEYKQIQDRIKWEIEGLGVDNSSLYEENDLKRRVIVEIGFTNE